MTDQQIIREVAEKVMKWKHDKIGYPGHTAGVWFKDKNSTLYVVGMQHHQYTFDPLTSWNDAGMVIERMRELGWTLMLTVITGEVSAVYAVSGKTQPVHATADSASRAIAIAALEALRLREER